MIRRGSLISRVLALLIFFAPLLVGGAAFGVWSWSNWSEASNRILRAETRMRELSALRIQAEAYEGLRGQWRDFAAAGSAGLAPPGTDSRTAEDMIARIRDALLGYGGVISDARALEALRLGGLQRTRVALSARIDGERLIEALTAMQTGAPFLFVELLSIRAANDGPLNAVDVTLHVSSYRLREARG